MKTLFSIIITVISLNALGSGLPLSIQFSSSVVMRGDTIWMELSNNDLNIKTGNLKWVSSIDRDI